jgi:hypothetical protein
MIETFRDDGNVDPVFAFTDIPWAIPKRISSCSTPAAASGGATACASCGSLSRILRRRSCRGTAGWVLAGSTGLRRLSGNARPVAEQNQTHRECHERQNSPETPRLNEFHE